MLLLDIKCHENDVIYIFQYFDKFLEKWKFQKILNKIVKVLCYKTHEIFRCKLMLDVKHIYKNIKKHFQIHVFKVTCVTR
jgi:hypothetical protein